ncbi:beta-lactamase [Aquimarina atlantica]|uniref:Beta-lactamase n=1 Tax=Aquimarina atlantica TaxID=1317122 RepID=A0A023C1C3_9FLAO|nr:serine hydrolase domain-containing protein [Aquimarina atlantica]EZH75738.1 beta-lactamase [Aquimarina atlantica]
MKTNIFYSILITLILASCSNKKTSSVNSYIGFDISTDVLESFLDSKMKALDIPGLSFAIINDGNVVYRCNKGYSDVERKKLVSDTTIFEGASISKSVFAFFVMTFVEEGKLDIDTPLYKYFPYPDIAYDERYKLITARMVLSHRTGFPNWREDEEDKRLKLLFDPDSEYGYSGEGYQYLALVLKEIEKTDWDGLERIFQKKVAIPLKMKHSAFIQNPYTRQHKAEPYDENGNWIDWKNDYWFQKEDNVFYAASSLHTNPNDFSKWMITVMNKKGVSKNSYEELLKPHSKVPYDGIDVNYTLGFLSIDFPFTSIFLHSGNNEGFTSWYALDTNKKWGFVVFTNSENGEQLGQELFFYLLTGPNLYKLYILVGIVLLIFIIGIFYTVKFIQKKLKQSI